MKRFLLVLLSLLCVMSLVMGTVSCEKPNGPEQPEQPEQPEDSVMMIDIVKDGKTDYRIVRRDAATGNDAGRMSAIKLKQAIKAATGCDIELTTDWTPDEDGKAYEILVGKVDRPAHEQIPKDLAKDEFVILFVENKILIDGGSENAITKGVNYFIKEYLGYDEENDTYAKTDLVIPEALNLRQTFEYPYEVYIPAQCSEPALWKIISCKHLL